MKMIGDKLSVLKNIADIQSLVKAENMVKSDDNTLEFKDDTRHLKLNTTDNSISFSYSESNVQPKRDEVREKFIKVCDSFDDNFFKAVCKNYTDEYGAGSLNTLHKNLTPDNIAEFYKFAAITAKNELKGLLARANTLNGYINTLANV